MLIDEIINSGIFSSFSGVVFDTSNEKQAALQRLCLSSAANKVSVYLGYDVNDLTAGAVIKGEYMSITIDADGLDAIKNTVMRIAALLQQEAGGHIGVNSAAEFGERRSYYNIVEYEPYLNVLSALRLVGGKAKEVNNGSASGNSANA